MASQTLTNVAENVWVEALSVRSDDARPGASVPWSVTKRTLRGGRRDGVDLIQIDNGALTFSVVPTRGMGLWRGRFRGDTLGWDSPVRDGPVHPAFVNLAHWGGLGWLEGFDELLARCGLEHNGPPYAEGNATYTLHGKVANIPAHFVALHLDDRPDGAIAVEGHVDESKLFSAQLRMVTTVSTAPGANWLDVRDEFRNLGDSPQDLQILYHWNFGPPYLGEGARFVAPARTVVPRDARAAEGLGHFDVYGKPEPGFAEQAYYFELLAAADTGRTLTMLRNRDGDKAVVLRFAPAQLPAFTLWKNTGGLRSGYVTGLEPGANYPNPKPFEKARGRVITLPPGGSYVAETRLEVLDTAAAVAAVEAEARALRGDTAPVIRGGPAEPFAPA